MDYLIQIESWPSTLTNKGDGHIELNWYEVGGVIYDGNDYVYVGDFDIWPGMPDRSSWSINWVI